MEKSVTKRSDVRETNITNKGGFKKEPGPVELSTRCHGEEHVLRRCTTVKRGGSWGDVSRRIPGQ